MGVCPERKTDSWMAFLPDRNPGWIAGRVSLRDGRIRCLFTLAQKKIKKQKIDHPDAS
jgi:hypothetical protein